MAIVATATAAVAGFATIGGLLVLGGVLYGVAHWRAWDPAWARSARHTAAEAGWRVSATWAEFNDWVRLGR